MRNRILLILILSLFLFAGSAQADTGWDTGNVYEVYTYGSGDYVASVFNGVAMITSGGTIDSLVKIGLILVFLYGMLISITRFIGSHEGVGSHHPGAYGAEGISVIISVAMTALIAVGVFMSPRATVAIIDRISPSQTQTVGNVPFPTAFMAYAISKIGDKLGEEFEQVFSLPDSIKFTNGGMALGAKYTSALGNILPPDSSSESLPENAHLISKSLKEYFIYCVFPNYATLDGLNGAKTQALDQLMTTGDLMAHLKNTGLYRNPNVRIVAPTDSGIASCGEAIDAVDSLWTSHQSAWVSDIEKKASGVVGYTSIGADGNPINLGSGVLTTTVIERYFPSSGLSKEQILKTLAIMNLMREAYANYAAQYSNYSQTALDVSQRQSVGGWFTAAKFFNALVGGARAIVEGLIYGLSVLLPLFLVFGGLRVITMYMKMALWLQLWVPIYCLINLAADIEVQKVITNILTPETVKSITFKSFDQISTQLETVLGYISSLSVIVPGLAWGLVSGGAYAITHAVSALTGGATAAAASAGQQIAGAGNLSLGNTNIGSHSAFSSTEAFSQQSFGVQQANLLTTRTTFDAATKLYGSMETYLQQLGKTQALENYLRIETMTAQKDYAGGANALLKLKEFAANKDLEMAKREIETAGSSDLALALAGDRAAIGMSELLGQIAGAGSSEKLQDFFSLTGQAHVAAQIEAAKAWADQRGGNWETAMVDKATADALFNTAKTLGAYDFLKEMGISDTAKSVTLGELQRGYNALALFNIGKMAGYKMNTADGRKQFYSDMTYGQGITLPVTNENVGAINAMLEAMGLKTRLKPGSVATLKGDQNGFKVVDATRGVSLANRDFTHKREGRLSEWENFTHKREGQHIEIYKHRKDIREGLLHTKDDTIQESKGYFGRSGYYEQNFFDVREDLQTNSKGTHKTFFYRTPSGKWIPVSGSTDDNVRLVARRNDKGGVTIGYEDLHETPLHIQNRQGEETLIQRRTVFQLGVHQEGVATSIGADMLESFGVDRDRAEDIMAALDFGYQATTAMSKMTKFGTVLKVTPAGEAAAAAAGEAATKIVLHSAPK